MWRRKNQIILEEGGEDAPEEPSEEQEGEESEEVKEEGSFFWGKALVVGKGFFFPAFGDGGG